jgi:hypothetical protein
MSEELVLANPKQDWLDGVTELVVSQGFTEVDNGFERVRVIRQPGQTISINGQVMQQPGKEIEIKQVIDFQSDGWVENSDGTRKMEFTQVSFEIYQGGKLASQYEDMFYWDEKDYFKDVVNHVFNR